MTEPNMTDIYSNTPPQTYGGNTMSLEQGVWGRHDDRMLKLSRLIRRRPEAGLKQAAGAAVDGTRLGS